jgi:ankyrin repeat protein
VDAVFEATLLGDAALTELLRKSPELARARAADDSFVDSIPHWLYVGDTPLHLSAAALRPTATRVLLDNGADANARNRRGAAPLHYACDLRPRAGGEWSPSVQAEVLRLLLTRGAETELADRNGATALHRAVRARSPAAVRELLGAGARVDARLRQRGSTPLHLAMQSTGASGTAGAECEQLEIIALLLEHGADPRALDARGRTPFDWAPSARARATLSQCLPEDSARLTS